MGNILEKLISDYNLTVYARDTKIACIKYSFKHNNVKVNIYFDMFDKQSPGLNLVLIYMKNYYYTSLNVSKINIPSQYLKQIPKEILSEIQDSNYKLTKFFERLNNEIMLSKPKYATYANDYDFTDALRYNKNTENLPFLYCLRHPRMTEKTLNLLQETFAISYKTLRSIQNHNMTIVRTGNPKYRKELTVILNENNILI
ncbi:MAG: hypothetical protein IJP62_04250 [Treponema sp.]|nr:hypothetical protein [Treponema sp.]